MFQFHWVVNDIKCINKETNHLWETWQIMLMMTACMHTHVTLSDAESETNSKLIWLLQLNWNANE